MSADLRRCGRTATWWAVLASVLTMAALLAVAVWAGVHVVASR